LIHTVLRDEAGNDASLSADALQLLMAHAWPGNIRQLRHVLRTAAALADGRPFMPVHLPSLVTAWAPSPASTSHAVVPDVLTQPAQPQPAELKLNPIQANERQVLLQMLEQHRWNVSNVAKALDVSRNTLYRKLHKLHIEVSHPE
jgi:sigma-54 dependent transcriptional regulator, acetoin dehydrogenase operon transcriptional activator AcoR